MILPSTYFEADLPGDMPVFRRRHDTITREQFRRDTATLAAALSRTGAHTATLLAEDNYHFAVALMAALHAGLGIILPGNVRHAEQMPEEGTITVADGDIPGAIPICGHAGEEAPLRAFDAAAAGLCFYTSGSSGEPKRIYRTFANLEAELQLLAGVLPEGERTQVFTTSPFHHAYGIIFGFLLPMSRGILCDTSPFLSPADFLSRVDAYSTPEAPAWIVTTPAFIRVWAENPDVCTLQHKPLRIQSAGAPLPLDAAQRLHAQTQAEFFEIFGSTETGVAAHRDPLATREWTPFAGVRISPVAEGGMWIDSPCIPPGERARPGDNAELLPNGNFLLLPRADNVVKIADKRISLSEIEHLLEGSELVSQAAVLKLEGKKRPILGAAIAPSPAGLDMLRRQGRTPLRRALVAHLSRHLPAVLIPRRWRIPGSFPTNARGKTDKAALGALFQTGDYMPTLSLLQQSDTRLVARALYPVDAAWTPGHFPGYPITPGIVILRTLSALTERCWGCTIRYIQRLKFNSEVTPGDEIYLILERREASLSILLSRTADGKTLTGKGTCRLSPQTPAP